MRMCVPSSYLRHTPYSPATGELASEVAASHPMAQASTSTKHPMEHGSDTSSEPSSPVAKTSKCNEAPQCKAPD
ncbi:hypothetical protein SK128_013994 [Halocaridina rubra]|uniref:Uncharacterized protein n=1 Tax=Halocaridina rubra TaxID=373956 RepID=A0AAN8XLP1_HALRR